MTTNIGCEACSVKVIIPLAKAPGFREIEHLPNHLEDPVRLVGGVPVLVVQIGDVFAFDIVDRHVAEIGQHEFLDQPSAGLDSSRLAPDLNMFDQIPFDELGHGGRRRLLRGFGVWILPGLDAGDHLGRIAAGLIGRDHAVAPDPDPLRFAARAGLDDVDLGPVGIDANTESEQFPIPVDGVLVPDRQLPDGPLGRHQEPADSFRTQPADRRGRCDIGVHIADIQDGEEAEGFRECRSEVMVTVRSGRGDVRPADEVESTAASVCCHCGNSPSRSIRSSTV